MYRIAFKMKLNSGRIGEYKKRHDEIWPELIALLKASAIADYSIFYDAETELLFATWKQNSAVDNENFRNNPITTQWWEYMADIMETNPDNSPVAVPLQEVFYLA